MKLSTLCPLVLSVLLAACASNAPAPVVAGRTTLIETPAGPSTPTPAAPAPSGPSYTVKKGDTLYAIALDQGLDYKDIVAWNGLDNPNRILVGQVLRLSSPDAPSGTGVVTRPIAAPANLEIKPVKPVDSVTTGVASTSTDSYKREPKGGKHPYSPEALDRLRKAEGIKSVEAAVAPAVAATPPADAPTSMSPAPAVAASASAIEWSWPLPGAVTMPFSEGSSKGIDIAAKLGEPIGAAAAGKVVYAGSGLRGYGKLVIIRHSADYLSAYAHAKEILVKEGQTVTRLQKIAEVGDTDTDHAKLHFEVRFRGVPVDPLKFLPPR